MKTAFAAALAFATMPYLASAQEDPTNKSAGQITATPAASAHPSAASAPASRAAVKQQARDAMQSGGIARGQSTMPSNNSDHTPSTASRDAVSGDATKMVHSTQPIYGSTTQYMQRNAIQSTARRADVKQQTKQAEADNQIPRGEAASMHGANGTSN